MIMLYYEIIMVKFRIKIFFFYPFVAQVLNCKSLHKKKITFK